MRFGIVGPGCSGIEALWEAPGFINCRSKGAEVGTLAPCIVIKFSQACEWLAVMRRRQPNSLICPTNSMLADSKNLTASAKPRIGRACMFLSRKDLHNPVLRNT
jgi:hypothetical protein